MKISITALLHDRTFTTVTTLALCFIIGYVVFRLLIGRVPVFQNREQRINVAGKTISLCLSGIVLGGAYKYLEQKGGIARLTSQLLEHFGTLGGLGLMAATFLAIFRKTDYPYLKTNWKLSTLLTGLTGMLYAGITSNSLLAILGVVLFFLPIIVFIASGPSYERPLPRRWRR